MTSPPSRNALLCHVKAPHTHKRSHTYTQKYMLSDLCTSTFSQGNVPHTKHTPKWHFEPFSLLWYFLAVQLFFLSHCSDILFLCISSLIFITLFCTFYPRNSSSLYICIACASRSVRPHTNHRKTDEACETKTHEA